MMLGGKQEHQPDQPFHAGVICCLIVAIPLSAKLS